MTEKGCGGVPFDKGLFDLFIGPVDKQLVVVVGLFSEPCDGGISRTESIPGFKNAAYDCAARHATVTHRR